MTVDIAILDISMDEMNGIDLGQFGCNPFQRTLN